MRKLGKLRLDLNIQVLIGNSKIISFQSNDTTAMISEVFQYKNSRVFIIDQVGSIRYWTHQLLF